MHGRNDRAIVDALEAMAHVMKKLNMDLLAQQNRHGVIHEFYGLGKFERNNLPAFMGRYDLEGAHTWLQKIENIFRVMAWSDEHKVLLGTHMLYEEIEYWWDNTRQKMEATGTAITMVNFKTEFLRNIFPPMFAVRNRLSSCS